MPQRIFCPRMLFQPSGVGREEREEERRYDMLGRGGLTDYSDADVRRTARPGIQSMRTWLARGYASDTIVKPVSWYN